MTRSVFSYPWLLQTRVMVIFFAGSVMVFIIAMILTSSVFMKPRYESEAVINVPLTLFSEQFAQGGIGFGGNAEIDWHIQLLLSRNMLDSLVKRFSLVEGWGYELGNSRHLSEVQRRLSSMVSVKRNRYGAVSVSVQSHDAILSASIASAMIELGDILRHEVLHDNRRVAVDFARERFHDKRAEVDSLERALLANNLNVQDNEHFLSEIHRSRVLFEAELWQLSQLRADYERLTRMLNTPLPATYIISRPVVSYKPVWPPRILLSVAAMVVFVIAFLFFETVKNELRKNSVSS